MTRPGLAERRRGGFDVVDYLAQAAQGATAVDPNAFRDVTLGQVRALYGKRRPKAPDPGQVMPYDEVLRRTFRLRGVPDEQVEAMVKQHTTSQKGVRRAASRR